LTEYYNFKYLQEVNFPFYIGLYFRTWKGMRETKEYMHIVV